MLAATRRGTAALALAAAVAACTPKQNASVLPGNQALTASPVSFGTVVSSRVVQLQGGQGSQAAGAVLGGLAARAARPRARCSAASPARISARRSAAAPAR